MTSPNQQYLIAQELAKIDCHSDDKIFDIVGYELEGIYKIGILSNLGIFPGDYIKQIYLLSQEYKFKFYITDTCSSFEYGTIYIIIY